MARNSNDTSSWSDQRVGSVRCSSNRKWSVTQIFYGWSNFMSRTQNQVISDDKVYRWFVNQTKYLSMLPIKRSNGKKRLGGMDPYENKSPEGMSGETPNPQ